MINAFHSATLVTYIVQYYVIVCMYIELVWLCGVCRDRTRVLCV